MHDLTPFDVTKEKPIPLAVAATLDIMPLGKDGKPRSAPTLFRWAVSGYHDVKLEAVRWAGTICTSREALMRFCERCTSPRVPKTGPTPRERQRANDRAKALLTAAGF